MGKHKVILPALGMAQKTGVIVEWLKQVGDQVEQDEAIMALETDKAVMEVPSPTSGTVLELIGELGLPIEVGAVVAYVGELEESGGDPPVAPEEDGDNEAVQSEETEADRETKRFKYSAVPIAQSNTELCNGDASVKLRPPSSLIAVEGKATVAEQVLGKKSASPTKKVLASPKAKMLADQRGISLQALQGHPQLSEPFQCKDVKVFLDWTAQKLASQSKQQADLQIQAQIPVQKFLETAAWLSEDSQGQISELQLWLCIQSLLLKEFSQELGLLDSRDSASPTPVACNLSMLDKELRLQQYSVADVFSYRLREELSPKTCVAAPVALFFSKSDFIQSWYRPSSERLTFNLCLTEGSENADFRANIAWENLRELSEHREQGVLDFMRVLLQVFHNPVPYLL